MLTDFFTRNLDIVFGIYGLSFFVMGIVILIQIQKRKDSSFKLSRVIGVLAGFGLSHGLNEWLEMFAIIKGHHSEVFNLIQLIVLTLSYIFLFEFGRRLILLSFPAKFLNKWVTVAFSSLVLILIVMLRYGENIWPRYFLGFPGGMLSAAGFILYYKSEENILKPLNIYRFFFTSAAAIFVYSLLGGIIVPKADFFPASVINTASFKNLFGFPVQVLRAICSVVLAWSVWKILGIFDWEMGRRLEKEKDLAVTKTRMDFIIARAAEMEKAYKNLKEMQDMLIQAEKMNAVGRLASGIAHEVKNPLGIIRQGADYLEGKLSSSPEKNVSEILGIIKDNIKRADNIVNTLVDFSRASKLEKKPEDINSILESSLILIQHRAMLEDIRIIRELGRNLPNVSVDKSKMEQVFINIFLNAIQAMPRGGNLFLRTYQARLSEPKNSAARRGEDYFFAGENVLIVEIEDTGTGIPEENLKKIFDPFFTTKEPGQGTGLGLSVTENILNMHKGLIEIESKEGKGTKVIITLKISDGGQDG